MLASCAPPCATELRVRDLQRELTRCGVCGDEDAAYTHSITRTHSHTRLTAMTAPWGTHDDQMYDLSLPASHPSGGCKCKPKP